MRRSPEHVGPQRRLTCRLSPCSRKPALAYSAGRNPGVCQHIPEDLNGQRAATERSWLLNMRLPLPDTPVKHTRRECSTSRSRWSLSPRTRATRRACPVCTPSSGTSTSHQCFWIPLSPPCCEQHFLYLFCVLYPRRLRAIRQLGEIAVGNGRLPQCLCAFRRGEVHADQLHRLWSSNTEPETRNVRPTLRKRLAKVGCADGRSGITMWGAAVPPLARSDPPGSVWHFCCRNVSHHGGHWDCRLPNRRGGQGGDGDLCF